MIYTQVKAWHRIQISLQKPRNFDTESKDKLYKGNDTSEYIDTKIFTTLPPEYLLHNATSWFF